MIAGMDKNQRSNSWTHNMWKAVQKYATQLVPPQDDAMLLPTTNHQAEKLLIFQQSAARHELLNDLGRSPLAHLATA